MEYIHDVNINEAVINVLDNKHGELRTNKYKLDLTNDTYKYLLKHIQKCLKSDNLMYGKFRDEGSNYVKNISRSYFRNEIDIIEAAKGFSEVLFDLEDEEIPNCDLITVSIITDHGPMIAILKMDYEKIFTHKAEKVNESEAGIDLICSEVLPGAGKKIKKAAFIKPFNENNEYDLYAIDDKWIVNDDENYTRNYFTKNFLKAKRIFNERDRTGMLLAANETFVIVNYGSEPAKAEKERSLFKDNIKDKLEVDLYEISNNIFNLKDFSEEEKAKWRKMATSAGLENKVDIDMQYLDKKISKVKLKIDKDISLEMEESTYKDLSKFEIQENEDGSINMVIKNITDYQEK